MWTAAACRRFFEGSLLPVISAPMRPVAPGIPGRANARESDLSLDATLNESQTCYPGTTLRLIYKPVSDKIPKGQEF